jgi:hypothetical protein
MRERLHHLATVETLQVASGSDYNRWADTRLDRWLVDWALRSGMEKTARKITQERDIEVQLIYIFSATCVTFYLNRQTLVDIDLFMDIRRIEEALLAHSCTEALAWCSENKVALRKMKVSLWNIEKKYSLIYNSECTRIRTSPPRIYRIVKSKKGAGGNCILQKASDSMARHTHGADLVSVGSACFPSQYNMRAL